MNACERANESVRVFSCMRVFVYACAYACVRVCETTIIIKALGPFKRAAHCNFAAAATLSMRQRQSSSASVIRRLQFLRWGFLRFSSRV